MTTHQDPKGAQSLSIPPTYEAAVEKIHALQYLLQEIKREYITYLNDEQKTYRARTSVILTQRRLDYVLKTGSGRFTRGINKIIDDHMLCRAAGEEFK